MGNLDISREKAAFDILIKDGLIADGTGNLIFKGDIAIIGDEIVRVDALGIESRASKIIDAENKIISPGFVDIHTHIDYPKENSILTDPYSTNFVMQGITTVIGGNCGLSDFSVGDFMNKINLVNVGPNIGLLMGHRQIREKVLGWDKRLPTPNELKKMRFLVCKGLEEGAFGLSSGLGYSPGNYADLNEMVELCKVIGEYNGYYSSHIREQSRNIRESWKEIIDTGKLSGAKVHIAHVQVIGDQYWGSSSELIDMLNKARNIGVNITCDAYPYESGGTALTSALIPNWVHSERKMKERLRNRNLLSKIKVEIADLLALRGGSKSTFIVSSISDQSIGKTYLNDVAVNWGLDPVDAVVKIALEFDNTWAIFFQSTEKDKEKFYSCPYCAVGSDAHCELNDRLKGNGVHPRSYGTMPRFLSEYVRKKKIVSLEEGIRKMTSLPAEIVGIKDRGVIAPGKKADLVIFDYDSIADNATYSDPHQYPNGIEYVFINGKIAVNKGVHQQILSGVGLYGPGFLLK